MLQRIIFFALLTLSISACGGGDSGDKGSGTGGSNSFSHTGVDCPLWNGSFERDLGNGAVQSISFQSRRAAGGAFEYSFSGSGQAPFVTADNTVRVVAQGGQTGTVKAACNNSALVIEAQEGSNSFRARYSKVDDRTVLVTESTDPDLNGTYRLP
jgi:hypothetical protein